MRLSTVTMLPFVMMLVDEEAAAACGGGGEEEDDMVVFVFCGLRFLFLSFELAYVG